MSPSLPAAGDAEPAEAVLRQACMPQQGHSHLPGPASASTSHHTARDRWCLPAIPESPPTSAYDVGVLPGEGGLTCPLTPSRNKPSHSLSLFCLKVVKGEAEGLKLAENRLLVWLALALAGRRAVAATGLTTGKDVASPPWGVCPSHTGSFCLPADRNLREGQGTDPQGSPWASFQKHCSCSVPSYSCTRSVVCASQLCSRAPRSL